MNRINMLGNGVTTIDMAKEFYLMHLVLMKENGQMTRLVFDCSKIWIIIIIVIWIQLHGPGKNISKAGEITEGVWKNGLPDGDAVLTRIDGTVVQLFFKDCHREKPGADSLPPSLPSIKLIAP